jgi:hypothetical protein
MTTYPQRPKFFAFRFCRLMAKVCLANEIGPDACWLLTTVAMCEDAKGYCGAVTYFNEHLAPLVGSGSVDSLARVRTKAVDAGWLHYEKGAKHVAARYWVVIPPQFCGRMDDRPDVAFDEDTTEYIRTSAEECAEETAENVRKKPRRNRGECAEHSTLTTSPSPDPEDCVVVASDTAPSASLDELFGFPCNGSPCWWSLTSAQVEAWQTLFPGVQVETECRKALGWVDANPHKRKTARGMKKFLYGWIARENDRGKHNGNGRQQGLPMLEITDGSH